MDMDGTKRTFEQYARSQEVTMIDLDRTPPHLAPHQYYTESAVRFTPLPPLQCMPNPTSFSQPQSLEPGVPPKQRGSKARLPLDNMHNTTNDVRQLRVQYCGTSLIDAGYAYPPPPGHTDHVPCAVSLPCQPAFEIESEVETENFTDRVYMINAGEGSWSGSLGSEDDIAGAATLRKQATEAIDLLELSKDASHASGAPADPPSSILPQRQSGKLNEEHQNRAWQMDLALRNTMRAITGRLLMGNHIILERHAVDEAPITCDHPLCAAPNGWVAADGHYVAVQGSYGTHQCYCLGCLEQLWDGKGMLGAPPPATVSMPSAAHLDSDVVEMYDGAPKDWRTPATPPAIMHDEDGKLCASSNELPSVGSCDLHLRLDSGGASECRNCDFLTTMRAKTKQPVTPEKMTEPGSLLHSRHAHSIHQPSAQPLTFESTPASTTSFGQWRLPPSRFQHLASYLQPGDTLSSRERALLALWKAASQEHLEWEEHLQRAERIRTYASRDRWCSNSDMDFSSSPGGVPVSTDADALRAMAGGVRFVSDREIAEPELEAMAGISRKQCRGKDLSAVFRQLGLGSH